MAITIIKGSAFAYGFVGGSGIMNFFKEINLIILLRISKLFYYFNKLEGKFVSNDNISSFPKPIILILSD